MALMRVLLAIFLLAILSQAQDNRCDNGSCKIGCCNEFGWCGFGPKCKSGKFLVRTLRLANNTVCGADTCKADCERKSECNPGFGSEWAQRDKCPLNVCCSEHGFCGVSLDEQLRVRLLTKQIDHPGLLWQQEGLPQDMFKR